MTPYFLCLHVFKFHKFLSKNKRPNFVSQWEQSKILTSYFLRLHVSSVFWLFMKLKKLEEIIGGILMPRLWYSVLLSNWFVSWLLLKLQQKLEEDFSWTISKKMYEIFNVFNCVSQCGLLFLICSWFFMKLQQKKSGRNLQWHFNAKTGIQSSLIKLIISDFSWSFSKKLEEIFICILMPRLWYNIVTLSSYIDFVLDFSWRISKKPGRNLYRLYYKKLLMSFQCRDIKYFTHCMGHRLLVGRFWNFLELFIP